MSVPVIQPHQQRVLVDLVMNLRHHQYEHGTVKVVNETIGLPVLDTLHVPAEGDMDRVRQLYMVCRLELAPTYPGSLTNFASFVNLISTRRVSVGPMINDKFFHVHFFRPGQFNTANDEFRMYDCTENTMPVVATMVADDIGKFLLFGKPP